MSHTVEILSVGTELLLGSIALGDTVSLKVRDGHIAVEKEEKKPLPEA